MSTLEEKIAVSLAMQQKDEQIKLLCKSLHGILVADGVINNTDCSAPELISIATDYIASRSKNNISLDQLINKVKQKCSVEIIAILGGLNKIDEDKEIIEDLKSISSMGYNVKLSLWQ